MRASLALAVILLAFLSACGLPKQRALYLPNPADAGRVSANSGCVKNGIDERAFREFGDTTVRAWLVALNKDDPNARLILKIDFITGKPPLRTVSVDAAMIRLEESGRMFVPQLIETETYGHDFMKEYTFQFASPSGVSENLRLAFSPGALRMNGRSIPYAPIRFSRVTEEAIVSYFCIPV